MEINQKYIFLTFLIQILDDKILDDSVIRFLSSLIDL